MIGGGGGGAGTAAESAATWTAVVRLISSFRSFQEATLPVAKPSAQAERRAPMLAILLVASHSESLQEQLCTSNYRPGLRRFLDQWLSYRHTRTLTHLLDMRLSMDTGPQWKHPWGIRSLSQLTL